MPGTTITGEESGRDFARRLLAFLAVALLLAPSIVRAQDVRDAARRDSVSRHGLRYTPILLTVAAGYYWRIAGDVPGQDEFFASTIGVLFRDARQERTAAAE